MHFVAATLDTLGRDMGVALDDQIVWMEKDIAANSSLSQNCLHSETEQMQSAVKLAHAMRQKIANLEPACMLGIPITMDTIVKLGFGLFSAFFSTLLRQIWQFSSS